MFHLAPHSTLNSRRSSLSPSFPVSLSSSSPNPDLLSTHPFIHCEDPRRDGTSTEFRSSTNPSVPWQKRRRTLCAPSWPETRPKGPKRPNLLTMENCENQAPSRKAPSTHSAAGRARVLQRRGRARVPELVKMAESMPVEAKRLSALETKSVTHKTLEVYAACVREFCDWSGLLADSNVEASAEDRARSFRALTGWKKASPSFSRRPLLAAVWSALAVEMCRIGGTLAAVLTLVMFEAYLRPGEMLSLRPSSFLAPTEGGVRW